MRIQHLVFLFWLVLLLGCSSKQSENQVFFEHLAAHCNDAFPGILEYQAPGFDLLSGSEPLIAHFRACSDREVRIPFHIETEPGVWDRSRTWIFTLHGDQIELRHDHRKSDGSEDAVTMYGGFSYGQNTKNVHQFQSVERSSETGEYRGWRIEIYPGERYVYGTVRDTSWTWRVAFDLRTPLHEQPPAPWGHD